MSSVASFIQGNRLIICHFQGGGYHTVSHPVSTPNEKYIVSFVYKNLSPPLAKLAVCVVFPDFCSIDRSPVLTHHH